MIIWYDYETDGVDPQHCNVLEFAAILTDDDMRPLSYFQRVVGYTVAELRGIYNRAPVQVRDMHNENGLWAEVRGSTSSSPRAGNVELLDHQVDRWLTECGVTGTLPGAGSGVAAFDLQVARAHMPAFASRLTYWSYDVGVVRRFAKRVGVAGDPAWDAECVEAFMEGTGMGISTHRALPDAARALAQWVWFERRFNQLQPAAKPTAASIAGTAVCEDTWTTDGRLITKGATIVPETVPVWIAGKPVGSVTPLRDGAEVVIDGVIAGIAYESECAMTPTVGRYWAIPEFVDVESVVVEGKIVITKARLKRVRLTRRYGDAAWDKAEVRVTS